MVAVRIRALALVGRQKLGGHARPGDEFEEHDVPGLALVRDGLAELVDEDLASVHRRLSENGMRVGASLGGGVHKKPGGGFARVVGAQGIGDPFAGWQEGRGPVEQAFGGDDA